MTAATSTNSLLAESDSYDANGNQTGTGYTTGTGNRLLSDGTFNYTYDNEGNRISRTRISNASADDYQTLYTWDNRNRMTSVTFKNNAGTVTKTVTYLYDYLNRWIGETIVANGTTQQTRFVYDGDQIVLEFDQTGTGNLTASNLSHRYLWGTAVDQLLADETVTSPSTAGSVVWPLVDQEGSVRDLAVYNSGANTTTVANHRVYSEYGVLESQTNAAVDCLFGYTGRALDKATSEQYNGARWYEAVTGRWLSEDPSKFSAGDANLYRYVGNNPVNSTDPTGLRGDGGSGGGGGGVSVGCGCGGYALFFFGDAEDIDGEIEGDQTVYVVPLCANGCGGSYNDGEGDYSGEDASGGGDFGDEGGGPNLAIGAAVGTGTWGGWGPSVTELWEGIATWGSGAGEWIWGGITYVGSAAATGAKATVSTLTAPVAGLTVALWTSPAGCSAEDDIFIRMRSRPSNEGTRWNQGKNAEEQAKGVRRAKERAQQNRPSGPTSSTLPIGHILYLQR